MYEMNLDVAGPIVIGVNKQKIKKVDDCSCGLI